MQRRSAGRSRFTGRFAPQLRVCLGLVLFAGACGDGNLKPSPARPTGDGGGVLPGGPDAPTGGGGAMVGGVAVDAACVTQSNRAERVPLDLYVMLDASYSMGDSTGETAGATGTPATKWEAIKAAINGFATDPQSAGIGLGVQIFPVVRPEIPEDCFDNTTCGSFGPCLLAKACANNPAQRCVRPADCGGGACDILGVCSMSNQWCTNSPTWCTTPTGNKCDLIPGYCELRDVCDAEPYAKPAVAIAELPGVAAAVKAALDARKPEGRTPTGPALAGALDHARARRRVDRTRRMAVVLGSDGFPSACAPNTIAGVIDIARAGGAGAEGVSTFAVGVVSPEDMAQATPNLKALAEAGGTRQPFIINALNTAADVTRDFLKALQDIRAEALACEFMLPPAPAGSASGLDYTRINVQFTDGGGAVTTIPNVTGAAACDHQRGGWYYDPPYDPNVSGAKAPSSIVTCAATCAQLKADPKGKVDVVLGCRTVVD